VSDVNAFCQAIASPLSTAQGTPLRARDHALAT